jgi:hypothetical protein
MQTVIQKAFDWNHKKLALCERLIKRTRITQLCRLYRLHERRKRRILEQEVLYLEEGGAHPDNLVRRQPFNPSNLEHWRVFRELIR